MTEDTKISIRLQALQLAVAKALEHEMPEKTVARAKAYLDFLIGKGAT